MESRVEMELELRDIFKIIYRHRLSILIFLVLALVGALVANEIAAPVYEAKTQVLVKGEKSAQQLVLQDVVPGSSPDRDLQNYIQILKSDTVLQKATGSPQKAAALKEKLKVEPVTGSDLIVVSVEGEDPKEIATLANEIVVAFSARLAEMSRQQAHSARNFIEEQLELVQGDLAEAEERLKAYKEDQQILAPEKEIAEMISQVSRIGAAKEEARLAKLEAQMQLSSLGRDLTQEEKTILSSTTLSRNPLIAQLEGKIGALEVELAGAQEKYTKKHPTIISLEAELAQAQRELNKQVAQVVNSQTKGLNPTYQGIEEKLISLKALQLGMQAKEDALSQLQLETEGEMGHLPYKELELARLARDVKVREEIYLMLSQRREEVRITEAMQTGDVHVVDPATAPVFPIKPRKMLNFAISFLLAVFIGIGWAFFMEYIDDTIKTPQELEAELGLPVLGTIPVLTEQTGRRRRRRSTSRAKSQIRQGR